MPAPGQALVVASLHPAQRQAVASARADRPLRIVCLDRAAGDRLRHGLGPELARRARVVPLDSTGAEDRSHGPGVATLAAWARLHEGDGPPPDLAVAPYLSPDTVRRLAGLLVRLNREPARTALLVEA